MTIHNLHCSEVSRWSRGGLERVASLRAAVVPEGEMGLESTPNGAMGAFYGEWQKANETGYTQHFFPWWYEESYQQKAKKGKILSPLVLPLTPEERELVKQHGLNERQIGWRRAQWQTMRDLAAQEYAEDPNSCFLASGECVFELAAIEKALGLAGKGVESEDNGRLTIWLPPQKGRRYIVGGDTAGGGAGGGYACAPGVERKMGMQGAGVEWHLSSFYIGRRGCGVGQRRR